MFICNEDDNNLDKEAFALDHTIISEAIKCPDCEFSTSFKKVFDKHMQWLHANLRPEPSFSGSPKDPDSSDSDSKKNSNISSQPAKLNNYCF